MNREPNGLTELFVCKSSLVNNHFSSNTGTILDTSTIPIPGTLVGKDRSNPLTLINPSRYYSVNRSSTLLHSSSSSLFTSYPSALTCSYAAASAEKVTRSIQNRAGIATCSCCRCMFDPMLARAPADAERQNASLFFWCVVCCLLSPHLSCIAPQEKQTSVPTISRL